MKYRTGEIYKDKKRNPTSIFLVKGSYLAQNNSVRVMGTVAAEHGYLDEERNLDSRSVEKMFPHKMFTPFYEEDQERTHK